MKKFILYSLFVFGLINFLYQNIFAKKNNNVEDINVCSDKNENFGMNINIDKKRENYVVEIPKVVKMDSRVALDRDKINIIKREQKNRLLKNEILFFEEVSTMNINSKIWNENISYIVSKIKKEFLYSIIIIIETYSNTQFTDTENIKESEQKGLVIANILRKDFGLNNTICVIGLGAEKNISINYNCAKISVIKDIGFYDSIQ